MSNTQCTQNNSKMYKKKSCYMSNTHYTRHLRTTPKLFITNNNTNINNDNDHIENNNTHNDIRHNYITIPPRQLQSKA